MAGQDALVTPPIRQSVEDANSAQANGIAQPMTEKSWYLFWDRLGKMANRQNWMVNVGTHADRPPAANMPNGAIYVEFDRGVIYQNWTGAWQYLAGTMYGTFAPDQRPTDLGSHDAGFDFRTTDQPPREFIWSGSAWVEVTAVTVGTHANRPAAAGEAEGNLYVEYDRGGVIYQNWVGGWQYLAGTMWGTLSPDQRPTDLGTRDAGFDYRTTDAPPREFVWSGTAWIEIGAEYWVNGTLIGTRPGLNLIAGSNVTISGSDNAGSDRVDVTVSSSGGGGTGGAVSSVFTRTGAVVAQAGDYSAFQVTNAVDQTSSYTNPAWILSLPWSKITGAPTVFSDPTTTKGDLIARGTAAPATRLGVGADGQVLTADSTQTLGVKWGAPATAPVTSVFTRTGAVVAAAGDYSAFYVPVARQVVAGTGMTGGGALSADVTLTAKPMGASGASHSVGIVPDPGATAGATHYLREDASWAVPPAGMTDPTTTKGDLIVHGTTTTRLGVGADTQILTADSTQTLGVKWAAGASQSPWTSDINGANFKLNNANAVGIGTTPALYPLDARTVGGTVTSQIHIASTNTDAGAYLTTTADNNLYISAGASFNGTNWIAKNAISTRIDLNTAGYLVFNSDSGLTVGGSFTPTARMVIASTGAIGIGTTSPACALDVAGTIRSTASVAPTGGAGIETSYFSGAGYILVYDRTGAAVKPLILQSVAGGMVGIGGTPTHQFQLSTDDAAKLSTSTWAISSGGAVKQNVRDLEGGLEVINRLRPTEAEYNGKGGTPKGKRVVSLIAEEVRKVLPHTVTEDSEGNLNFSAHEVIFQLVLAVQQLSKRIG